MSGGIENGYAEVKTRLRAPASFCGMTTPPRPMFRGQRPTVTRPASAATGSASLGRTGVRRFPPGLRWSGASPKSPLARALTYGSCPI